MVLPQKQNEHTEENLLKKAAEVINRIDDPKIAEMIYRLGYTQINDLNIDMQDQMNIYNWLRELELYRKLCGPLNKV